MSATPETFLQALNGAAREQRWANSRPRDAATLILIDRAPKAPSVLMGKRRHDLKFMPGKFVFPGGRVDPADGRMASADELNPVDRDRLVDRMRVRPSAHRARAIALAAIRETFEETGLLLGRQSGGDVPAPDAAWKGFAEKRVLPELSKLTFVARAITPPRRPKRFDTRFFIADRQSVADEVGGIVGPDAELVELVWIPLAEAKTLDMPDITRVVLEEVDLRLAATRDVPVPFYAMRAGRFERYAL